MTAQAAHDSQPYGPVPAIAHTINGIGEALTGADRARFYAEVLAAEADDVPAVMRRWWKTAMLNRTPGAAISRANAAAGRRLTPVEDLLARLEHEAE